MKKYDRSGISNFMHWFGLVMVATYFGLGLYILYTPSLNYIDKNNRIIFSLFFFAYGAFRGVRWYLKNKSRKYYEETDVHDF